ncbi:hypothetical protein NQ176_g9415 [Zarea fungicola]|uniref:Uncharacterized protein n=1 Tax=Zarea fungicola TaxID=93591 RepID=A0ACC1MLT6_9HYPO|nr:hypothetical protein NQ176_g9415 [Lecanicillium fungicola]
MDRLPRSPGAAASQSWHPHVNLARQVAAEVKPSLWSRIARRSDLCNPNETCGRGISPNATNLAIALGVVIPVIAAAITFFVLHRRSVKRMRMEDAKYRETNLDYGLDEPPSKGKRLTAMFGPGGEKQQHRPGQLSMDMNLSSPYLLPPGGVHQSKESLHSLAKSYNNEQDPYHTVPLYSGGGDGASIRSMPYSPVGNKRLSFPSNLPPRTHSRPPPQSPLAPTHPREADPFQTPTIPEPAHVAQVDTHPQLQDKGLPIQPIIPEIGTVHEIGTAHDAHHVHNDDESIYEMPDGAPPPAGLAKDPHASLPMDNNFHFELPATVEHNPHAGTAAQLSDDLGAQNPHDHGLGLNVELPTAMSPEHPHNAPVDHDRAMYDEYGHPYPQIQTTEYYEDTHYVEDDAHHGYADGLGVPQTSAKRLSVGVVPLPPSEVTSSEDPEYRANRIRSFYKEIPRRLQRWVSG